MGIDETVLVAVAVLLYVEDSVATDSDVPLDDTAAEVTTTAEDLDVASLTVKVGLSVLDGFALSLSALLDGMELSIPQAPGNPSQIKATALKARPGATQVPSESGPVGL